MYTISNELSSDFANKEIRNYFPSCYPNSVVKRWYIEGRCEGIQETKGKHKWDPS